MGNDASPDCLGKAWANENQLSIGDQQRVIGAKRLRLDPDAKISGVLLGVVRYGVWSSGLISMVESSDFATASHS